MSATEQRINEAAMRLFAERGSHDLTMSDLASEARVARGTLYRNVDSVEALYSKVVEELSTEMHARVGVVLDASGLTDPAERFATGLRMLIRHAHENPTLGRFITRFGLADETLHGLLTGQPKQDLAAGIDTGRYTVPRSMELSIASLMLGSAISAMRMVLDGHQGWREAGSTAAELILRALGIAPEEARALSTTELPTLTEG